MIIGGTDKSTAATINNPDNYYFSELGTGSMKFVFDAAGNATMHTLRLTFHVMAHYAGIDAADGVSPAFDSSRTKVDSECDKTAAAAAVAGGVTLELCHIADPGSTDTADGTSSIT